MSEQRGDTRTVILRAILETNLVPLRIAAPLADAVATALTASDMVLSGRDELRYMYAALAAVTQRVAALEAAAGTQPKGAIFGYYSESGNAPLAPREAATDAK